MFSLKSMPSTTSVLSAYTAFTASAMLVRTVINEVQGMTTQLVPEQLQQIIISKIGRFWGNPSSQMMTLIIDEYNGYSVNQMYEASELYLGTRISSSLEKVRVLKAPREKNLKLTINKGEKIVDTFQGIQLIWEIVFTETKEPARNGRFESRVIELGFNKKHMEKVLSSYLPFVMEESNAIKEESKVVKLYSLGAGGCEVQEDGQWGSTDLDHPSTFETLAMEPALKKALIDDLDRFVNRRDYYRRVGKAWKRGYLLYGPPGTGKSSLVAAMANYLKFHIYDLELGNIYNNSDLRRLLVSTKNRSIVVIEDIDCSIDLQNQQARRCGQSDNQLTLSGLLNFIDGLWSSCGDERIIVFTTNHKDKLDPALLRPGRMDMHIHMSYCTPSAFKIIASNYLGISAHSLLPRIDELIMETDVTPAEIAEELMKSEDANVSLNGLVEFLEKKMEFLEKKKMERSEQGEEQESAEGETQVGGKRKATVGTFGGPKKIRSKRKAKEVQSMVTEEESELLPEHTKACFHRD